MPRASGIAAVLLCLGSVRNMAAQDCSGISFLASAIVVTGSAVYDLATAPASARRYNRQHFAIAPILDPRRGSFGFRASWSFGRASRVGAGTVTASALKSPATAAVLSLVSTGGPILTGFALGDDTGAKLFLGGLIIGPSVGHLYAEQFGRALGTMALRGIATAVGLWSIGSCFSD